MKKVLLSFTLAAFASLTASAAPILVSVGFNGTLNNGVAAPVAPGATSVTFTSTSFNPSACNDVTFCNAPLSVNSATFDSAGAASIFTWNGGTLVYTTTSAWTVLVDGVVGNRTFTINTTGTYTSNVAGATATAGNLNFTFQEPPVTGAGPSFYTFSASGTTVPEPGSMALLGSGLVGLGYLARRRRK